MLPTSQLQAAATEYEAGFHQLIVQLATLPIAQDIKEKLLNTTLKLNQVFHNVKEGASVLLHTVQQAGLNLSAAALPSRYPDPESVLGLLQRVTFVYRVDPWECYLRLNKDRDTAADIDACLNFADYPLGCIDLEPPDIYKPCAVFDTVTELWHRGYIQALPEPEAVTVALVDIGRVVLVKMADILPLDIATFPILGAPPTVYRCRFATIPGPADSLPWHPDVLTTFDDLLTGVEDLFLNFQFAYRGSDGAVTYMVCPTDIDLAPIISLVNQYDSQNPNASSTADCNEPTEVAKKTATCTCPLHGSADNAATRTEPATLLDEPPVNSQPDIWDDCISIMGSTDSFNSDSKLNLHPTPVAPDPAPVPISISQGSQLSLFTEEATRIGGSAFHSPIHALLYLVLLQISNVSPRAANQAAWLLMTIDTNEAIEQYVAEDLQTRLPVGYLFRSVRRATLILVDYLQWVKLFFDIHPKTNQPLAEIRHYLPHGVNLEQEMYCVSTTLYEAITQPPPLSYTMADVCSLLPLNLTNADTILVLGDSAVIGRIDFAGNCEVRKVDNLLASSAANRQRSATHLLGQVGNPAGYAATLVLLGPSDIHPFMHLNELRRSYNGLIRAMSRFPGPIFLCASPPRIDDLAPLVPQAASALQQEANYCPKIVLMLLEQLDKPAVMLHPRDGVTLAARGLLRLMRVLLERLPQLQVSLKRA